MLSGGRLDTSIRVRIRNSGRWQNRVGGCEIQKLRNRFPFELEELPGIHGVLHRASVVQQRMDFGRYALVGKVYS